MQLLIVDVWIDLASVECQSALRDYRNALSKLAVSEQVETLLHPYFPTDHSLHTDNQSLAAQRLLAFTQQLDPMTMALLGADSLHLRTAAELFAAGIDNHLDLNSPEVLSQIGRAVSLADSQVGEAMSSPIVTEAIDRDHSLTLHLGVDRVPLFLFDEQFVVTPAEFTQGSGEDSFGNILETAWRNHRSQEN